MSVLPAGFTARDRTSSHTSVRWLTDARRAGAAWVGRMVRSVTESPHGAPRRGGHHERAYMERARMAREMERL